MRSTLAALVLVASVASAQAADKAQAEAALDAANQQQDKAGALGNRWLPAEAALKDATKAMAANDWTKAIDAAQAAQALATRAIEQAHEQEIDWREMVIK